MSTEKYVSLDFVKKICRMAGGLARSAQESPQQMDISPKGSLSDLVTDTDMAVEEFLISKIKEAFPTHKFLCEESCRRHQRLTDEPTWVIDPIDGTSNFVQRLPLFTISIGYCVGKKTQIGVIYNVMLDEMYCAEKGKGAFLNGRPISCIQPKPLESCVIATGFCRSLVTKAKNLSEDGKLDGSVYTELKDLIASNTLNLLNQSQDLRRLGACSYEMCLTARGVLDAFVELGPKEWDIAAGVLLVQEAGGYVCTYQGELHEDMHERTLICGQSKSMCDSLVALVEEPKNFKVQDFE